jgi:3-methyladenine DNA glycosylase AlkD
VHAIKLNVQDSIYEHIMFLLKNLKTEELVIVEDKTINAYNDNVDTTETQTFANHSASLIKEWQDDDEDNVWK